MTPVIGYTTLNIVLLTEMFQALVFALILFLMLRTRIINRIKFRNIATAAVTMKKTSAAVVVLINLIKCSSALKPVARLT